MILRNRIQYMINLFASDEVTLMAIRLRGVFDEVRDCHDSSRSIYLLGQAVDGLYELAEFVAPDKYGRLPVTELLGKCGIVVDKQLMLKNVLRTLSARLETMETGLSSSMQYPAVDVVRITETLNKVLEHVLEEHRARAGSLWKRGVLRLCILIIAGAFLWAMFSTGYFVWKNLQKQGIRVTYYKGENFEHKMGFNTEFALVKDFGRGRPVWWMPKNHFSSRWEGWILAPVSTNYAFYSQSDEGLRFKIDDKIVIDDWRGHQWQTRGCHGNMFLDRGSHRIVVEHYDSIGPSALQILWCGGPIPPDTVISAPFLSKIRQDPVVEQALP